MDSEFVLSVLLVDDQLTIATAVEEKLREIESGWTTDFEHIQSLRGEELVNHLMDQDYHVIFMDYQLGEDNGLDITRTLRQRGYQRPIILLTGHDELEVVAEALRKGADDYIPKDTMEADDFRDSIRFLLQQFFDQDDDPTNIERAWVGLTDSLTGFLNRDGLTARLKRPLKERNEMTHLVASLNNLDSLNAIMGIDTVDGIIAQTGEYLEELVPNGLYGRPFGGIFYVLLPEGDGQSKAQELAEQLKEKIRDLPRTIDAERKFNLNPIVTAEQIHKTDIPAEEYVNNSLEQHIEQQVSTDRIIG